MVERDDQILGYLQDRLGTADREVFENAMAKDASLAAEVELMRSVRAELRSGPVHENADMVWERLSATMDAAEQPANDNRPPWVQIMRYVAVAAMAIAAWQVGVVPRISEGPDGFRTASEQSAGFVLQVRFVDSATIAEISAILRSLEGTITEGPGALGLFQVSFRNKTMQQRALDEFGNRGDLVELALEQ